MSTRRRLPHDVEPPPIALAVDGAARAHEIARLRNAIECCLAGMWECELATQRLVCDARASALVESPDSHQAPASLSALELLIHPQDLEHWQQRWRDYLAGHGERLECEVRLARGPGRWAWVLWRGRRMASADGSDGTVAGVVLDVHQAREAEAQLSVMAQRDALTELPNRALLADRLEHALAAARRNSRPLVVLGVLLDGVQAIDEALGQEMGHLVIKQAARRIATCTRASDSVARSGHDEFVLLLEDVDDPADVSAVTDKLRQHVNEPLVVDGHWLQVTARIGTARYPMDGDSVFGLLEHATQAARRG